MGRYALYYTSLCFLFCSQVVRAGEYAGEIHCRSVLSGFSLGRVLEGPRLDGEVGPMREVAAKDDALNIRYSVSTFPGLPSIIADNAGRRIISSGDPSGIFALEIVGLSPDGTGMQQHFGCIKAEELTIYCSSTKDVLDKYIRCSPFAKHPSALATCAAPSPGPGPGPSFPPPGPIGPPPHCN